MNTGMKQVAAVVVALAICVTLSASAFAADAQDMSTPSAKRFKRRAGWLFSLVLLPLADDLGIAALLLPRTNRDQNVPSVVPLSSGIFVAGSHLLARHYG